MNQSEIVYDALEKPLPPELLKAKIGNWLPEKLAVLLITNGTKLTIIAGIAASISYLFQLSAIVIGICFSVVALLLGITLLIEITKRTLRLELFCSQNSFSYVPSIADPIEQGMIFSYGENRRLADVISGNLFGQDFMIANYSYETGTGKDKQTHSYGCIKLKLPRVLPHMVLDAVQNNFFGKLSNLPAMFDDDQRLSLEGDFDSHFSLYCPKEYERDALYIFTPDLMALLIDESATFDIEIIDDSMYLYSAGTLSVTSRAVLERLFNVVTVVGRATNLRADDYSDERVASDVLDSVAPQGTRLRPLGMNFSAVIIIVILIAIVAVSFYIVGSAFLRALP